MNGEVKGEGRQSLTHICCVAFDNDALKGFWEIEDHNLQKLVLSPDEKAIVKQFERYHVRDKGGRFIVPLPQKANVILLGDSRTQVLCRLKALE